MRKHPIDTREEEDGRREKKIQKKFKLFKPIQT